MPVFPVPVSSGGPAGVGAIVSATVVGGSPSSATVAGSAGASSPSSIQLPLHEAVCDFLKFVFGSSDASLHFWDGVQDKLEKRFPEFR